MNLPPAFAAVAALPTLWDQAGPLLLAQRAALAARDDGAAAPVLLAEVLDAAAQVPGGVVRIADPRAAAVIAWLVCQRGAPGLIGPAVGVQGVLALGAQLIAYAGLALPLVSPAAASDARVIERLIAAAAPASGMLLIAIDPPGARWPAPLLLPTRLPPTAVLVLRDDPQQPLPLTLPQRLLGTPAAATAPASDLHALLAICGPLPVVVAALLLDAAESSLRAAAQPRSGLWLIDDTLGMRATPAYPDTALRVYAGRFAARILALCANAPERSGWPSEALLAALLPQLLALGQIAHPVVPYTRSWIAAQERRSGGLAQVATDARWALTSAAPHPQSNLAPTMRAALIAATLASLARTLPARLPGVALRDAVARGVPREQALRQVRQIVDDLPAGLARAACLRQLGEASHALGARTQSLRMLSEALDLEAPGLPRSWHEEREETLVALARAALQRGDPDVALGITASIANIARRGLIETEVVRRLIGDGRLRRAEEVAVAIGHAATHDWAMAEVAWAHERTDDPQRAALVQTTIGARSAQAWLAGERAAAAARRGAPDACAALLAIPSVALRDRALARVLAAYPATQIAALLAAAAQIADPEQRARALIEQLAAHPAAAALHTSALAAVAVLVGETRAAVLVQLAAAVMRGGDLHAALRTAAEIDDAEARDRAHARIATALAAAGDLRAAAEVAAVVEDDDERDWTLGEIALVAARTADAPRADALLAEMLGRAEHDRAAADVAIALARGGAAFEAHSRAIAIDTAAERMRALVLIAAALVQQQASATQVIACAPRDSDERSRYLAAAVIAGAALPLETIDRPTDRCRAAFARWRARPDTTTQAAALAALASVCDGGRRPLLDQIAWGAETLGALGGAELLLAIASSLNEVDGWWS